MPKYDSIGYQRVENSVPSETSPSAVSPSENQKEPDQYDKEDAEYPVNRMNQVIKNSMGVWVPSKSLVSKIGTKPNSRTIFCASEEGIQSRYSRTIPSGWPFVYM